MGDLRTSSYLREQLDDFDRDDSGSTDEGDAIAPEDRALLTKLQVMLVESYEALSTDECERVHSMFSSNRSLCEYFLDDHFARHLVDEVPQIVQRVMKFEPIIVSKVPTGPVNVYLREAVRCHIHGLHQGAVTLARAAMEQGLRERVPFAADNRWTLDELIEAAGKFSVLKPMHLQMATDVQHSGNRVLHQQPCNANQASDALTKARAVLEQLFA
jgi:hypothetical protein